MGAVAVGPAAPPDDRPGVTPTPTPPGFSPGPSPAVTVTVTASPSVTVTETVSVTQTPVVPPSVALAPEQFSLLAGGVAVLVFLLCVLVPFLWAVLSGGRR